MPRRCHTLNNPNAIVVFPLPAKGEASKNCGFIHLKFSRKDRYFDDNSGIIGHFYLHFRASISHQVGRRCLVNFHSFCTFV